MNGEVQISDPDAHMSWLKGPKQQHALLLLPWWNLEVRSPVEGIEYEWTSWKISFPLILMVLINKTSNKERSKWYSIFRMLHPIDATHGSLALKAYQQNLYLEYYY